MDDLDGAKRTAPGELLLRAFGPVADAFAVELAKLPPFAVRNLERLADRLQQRRRNNQEAVSPRLLRRVLDEGAWSEHEVVAEYLSGVLAASGSDEANDRGLGAVALVQRLSAIQLRAHYLIYRELVLLSSPVRSPEYVDFRWSINRAKYHLEFPLDEFLRVLGIDDADTRKRRAILNHVVFGLTKEELVDPDNWDLVTPDWMPPGQSTEHVSFHPTPLGSDLFLWGCGSPVVDQSLLFDPSLELVFDLDVQRPRGATVGSDIPSNPLDVEEADRWFYQEDASRLEAVAQRLLRSDDEHYAGYMYMAFAHALNENWAGVGDCIDAGSAFLDRDDYSRWQSHFHIFATRNPRHRDRVKQCAVSLEAAYRRRLA